MVFIMRLAFMLFACFLALGLGAKSVCSTEEKVLDGHAVDKCSQAPIVGMPVYLYKEQRAFL